MNIIDRVMLAISPKKFLEREIDRARADIIANARSAFKSADTNRLNSSWDTTGADINTELTRKLKKMRQRSRWLTSNNPHAKSALNVLINYSVGNGIFPMSAVRRYTTTVNKDGTTKVEVTELESWNDYTDDQFELWSHHVDYTCTLDNPTSFREFQVMALKRWWEDGEVFIRTRELKGWPGVPFACEMLMPEWLNENITSYGGNDVIMGIEIDKLSRPVAYHFRTSTRAGEIFSTEKSIRIKAEEIIHIFVRSYPRQLRGIPAMVAVMEKFFHLDEYVDFELISAKIAACFGAFITTPAGDTGGVVKPGEEGSNVKDAEGNILATVEPGIIGKLPPGYGVSFAQPQKPGTTFGMFTEFHQRAMGAGCEFGLSYESITRDTSKTAYAGGRLSQLGDFQTFKNVQLLLSDKLVRPIRRRWMEAAVNSAAISAPGYFTTPGPEFWQRVEMLTSGWPWGINPVQEVTAARESMRAGITTLADECAYLGRDWKQQIRLAAKIKREADAAGLMLTSDAGHDKTQNVSPIIDPAADPAQTASVK